jgi:hypothetical protein
LGQGSPEQTANDPHEALNFAQGHDAHEFEGGSAGPDGVTAQQTLDGVAPGLLRLIGILSTEQQNAFLEILRGATIGHPKKRSKQQHKQPAGSRPKKRSKEQHKPWTPVSPPKRPFEHFHQ